MKSIHIDAAPEMIAAHATAARLKTELATIETQIATIEAARLNQTAKPRDPVSDAIALMDGTAAQPSADGELGRLYARREAVAAGANAADERALSTRRELSRVYMVGQTGRTIAALDALACALQAALDVGKDFDAIRADAAALGYDSAAAGLPLEIGEGQRPQIEIYLRTAREFSEELSDRISPDGPAVTVRVLAELEGHDAQPGDVVSLPGKTARLFVRLGRAELATGSTPQRSRKRATATPAEHVWSE